MNFPKKIKFLSDDNEAVFVSEEKTKDGKIVLGYYEYTPSSTKSGRQIPMDMEQINKLISFKLLEIL